MYSGQLLWTRKEFFACWWLIEGRSYLELFLPGYPGSQHCQPSQVAGQVWAVLESEELTREALVSFNFWIFEQQLSAALQQSASRETSSGSWKDSNIINISSLNANFDSHISYPPNFCHATVPTVLAKMSNLISALVTSNNAKGTSDSRVECCCKSNCLNKDRMPQHSTPSAANKQF